MLPRRRSSSVKVGRIYYKPSPHARFGFESSFELRWDSAKAFAELRQSSPYRYLHSPISLRKTNHEQPPIAEHRLVPRKSCLSHKANHSNATIRQNSTDTKSLDIENGTEMMLLETNEENKASKLVKSSSYVISLPINSTCLPMKTAAFKTVNSFGTSVSLSSQASALGGSTDSLLLPPPPSPRTLRRTLSTE